MSYPLLEVALATTRKCPDCGKIKNLARDFHVNRASKTGRTHKCAECNNADSAEWYATHPGARVADKAIWWAANGWRFNVRPNVAERLAYVRQWRADNSASVRAYGGLRRARKYGANYEPVNYEVLFAIAEGICQECLDPVDPTLTYINPETGLPDPGYGTTGHIIDLAAGGDHTYANTRLEHLGCNRERPRTPRAEREQDIAAIFYADHAASVRAFWEDHPLLNEGEASA